MQANNTPLSIVKILLHHTLQFPSSSSSIMGFSYILSKLVAFNALLNHYHHQLLLNPPGILSSLRVSPNARIRDFPVFSSLMEATKRINSHAFFEIQKRFCHTNNQKNELYKPMPRSKKPDNSLYIPKPETLMLEKIPKSSKGHILYIGFGMLVTALFGRVERIPYSRRFHLVFSEIIVKKFAEYEWKKLKEEYKGRILSPKDPTTIRVGRVTKEIIQALHTGLRLESECIIGEYDSEMSNDVFGGKLFATSLNASENEDEEHTNHQIEVCHEDVLVVQQKNKKNLIWKPATKHLKGEKWEVIVIDSYINNACYIPGGKIVVFKGLLHNLKSDAELAIVISHEVGHGVARHGAELLIRFSLLLILFPILISKGLDLDGRAVSDLSKMITIRINRRREVKADYIGMMLMASAGYDPREVPDVYQKKIYSGSEDYFLRSHPSGTKRANYLKQPKKMEEAISVYNEVKSGCRLCIIMRRLTL